MNTHLIEAYVRLTGNKSVAYALGDPDHGLEPDSIHDYLGTQNANGEPSQGMDQRLRRCYELAAWCVAYGSAPAGSTVVHGSWHGPGAPQRIGHAWVKLPMGLVWEPIRGNVFLEHEFYRWTSAIDEREYAFNMLAARLMRHGDFGRWHESVYP